MKIEILRVENGVVYVRDADTGTEGTLDFVDKPEAPQIIAQALELGEPITLDIGRVQ